MTICITAVPKGISAADYLDKETLLMMKGRKFKTVESRTMDTRLGPTRDTLISYSMNNIAFLSRMCAFKVEDDRKEYVPGEKHLLYLIQINVRGTPHRAAHDESIRLHGLRQRAWENNPFSEFV